jgi:hypothetical protein
VTALKGAGQCALSHRTAGNDKFAASSATYPFILQPGSQSIEKAGKRLLVGKARAFPTETSFGSPITYSSLSKNCRVESNLIQALEKGGTCTILASAPAKEGMWLAMSVQLKVLVSALTPRR